VTRYLRFKFDARPMRAHDAAVVMPGEDPADALRDAVLSHISTDTSITIAGVTNHLAAWLDPEHWADDWDAKEIDTDAVSELLYAALEEE
jgi:hypothetical protein